MGRRRTAAVATAVLCSFIAFATAGQAAAACPNEVLRSGASGQLPDCRAYEMVSPRDMNGNGIMVAYGIRGDGDAIGYATINAFGDEAASSILGYWLADRGADGWTSTSINPPTLGRIPSAYDQPEPLDIAGDYSSVLMGTRYPYDLRDQAPYRNLSQPGNGDLYRFMPGPRAEWITYGPNLPMTASVDNAFGGASTDLSRIFFETTQSLSPLTAGSTAPNIYERHNGELTVVNADSEGNLIPGGAGTGRSESAAAAFYGEFGATYRYQDGLRNQGHAVDQTAVSTDGQVVYFSAPRLGPRQIYVRVDGSTTVDVSRCQYGPCAGEGAPAGAVFIAATPDGSSMLFSSPSRLLEAAPEGGGVYRFDLATRSLSFVTPLESGGAVQAVTSDLATIYLCGSAGFRVFRAGALHQIAPIACESMGSARRGEPRITPSTGYLFTTKAGPREIPAGEAMVAAGESRIVTGEEQVANGETAAGEFQIKRGEGEIATGKKMITAGGLFSYENAGFSEVYRYDPASGKFSCLSCRLDGSAPEAGSDLTEGVPGSRNDPTEAEGIEVRNLSDDGTRVVFSSREALVPADVNGTIDVYEWELAGTGSCGTASSTYSARSGGCVFLVSSGDDPRGAVLEGMSADGNDIFFASEKQLVPSNTGTELQIYDARVDGGIASQQAVVANECEGSGCRLGATAPPLLPQPTTNSYSGAGNVKAVHRCLKPKRHRKKARRHSRGTTRQRAAARAQRATKSPHKKASQRRCTAGANRRAGK